jgi:hypothetical protein
MSVINATNDDDQLDSVIISLDAKKAFDSVEHSYIVKCLEKFGLNKFVPIFKLLYEDLTTDIIINGKICKGYKIKRGVKQGDSLSCVLFIMCMEPLLINIERNPDIERLEHTGVKYPKVAGYADDVTAMIKNTRKGVQAIFTEYQRLSRTSGLQLNADKTELMRIRTANEGIEEVYQATYLDERYIIKSISKIKINGIIFQADEAQTRQVNVEKTIEKINSRFKSWSKRGLSTLGKILIVKTYGIANIIFLMQSLCLTPNDMKLFNSSLYKFIWNKHYLAAKAPDRIKREILNKPVLQGGFGMLDIVKLDEGIKLKSLGRLFQSKHPLMSQIRDRLNMSDYFFPHLNYKCESFTNSAIRLLKLDRQLALKDVRLRSNRTFNSLIRRTKLKNVVNRIGKLSVSYFRLIRSGKLEVGDLSQLELAPLERFIVDKNFWNSILEANSIIDQYRPTLDDLRTYPYKDKLVQLSKLSSREIRTSREILDPICIYKCGLILTPYETTNYMNILRKLTSVAHRNTLLRALHGDVFTNDRLFRRSLTQDDCCPRCGDTDTLEHRFEQCPQVKNLVDKLKLKTNGIGDPQVRVHADTLTSLMAAYRDTDSITLTIHAELLKIVCSQQDLTDTERIINRALNRLFIRDNSLEVKNVIARLI